MINIESLKGRYIGSIKMENSNTESRAPIGKLLEIEEIEVAVEALHLEKVTQESNHHENNHHENSHHESKFAGNAAVSMLLVGSVVSLGKNCYELHQNYYKNKKEHEHGTEISSDTAQKSVIDDGDKLVLNIFHDLYMTSVSITYFCIEAEHFISFSFPLLLLISELIKLMIACYVFYNDSYEDKQKHLSEFILNIMGIVSKIVLLSLILAGISNPWITGGIIASLLVFFIVKKCIEKSGEGYDIKFGLDCVTIVAFILIIVSSFYEGAKEAFPPLDKATAIITLVLFVAYFAYNHYANRSISSAEAVRDDRAEVEPEIVEPEPAVVNPEVAVEPEVVTLGPEVANPEPAVDHEIVAESRPNKKRKRVESCTESLCCCGYSCQSPTKRARTESTTETNH